MELEIYDTSLNSELKDLPGSDREEILRRLHIAIADGDAKCIVPLNYFRDGKSLCIFKAEYMDLYNVFKR